MFRRTSHGSTVRTPRRRGAILLVVLTMLALFAVIGLSFVLYAESEANASRLNKEAANADLKPIDATDAINGFLGQMIFQQDQPGSALNGHELARLMYGQPGNTSAYNGVGMYEEKLDMPSVGLPIANAAALYRSQVVRYGRYTPDITQPLNYVVTRPDETYANAGYVEQGNHPSKPSPLNFKYVGRNGPYTYPDRNNLYLGVQDPATGRVVKPSYHSPSLFGTLAANNLNWYTPQGYFQLLRPRPIGNLTSAEAAYLSGPPTGFTRSMFPAPVDLTLAEAGKLYTILSGNSIDPLAPSSFKRAFPFPAPNPDGSITGDVQNVKYGEGRQTADSVWIDAKLPLVTFRGRKLQPLIAATVLDLGGRVNYNTAGNLANLAGQSSNHGFGPAEVSLFKILQAADTDAPPKAVQNMLKERYGTGTAAPSPSGSSRTLNYFHEDPAAPANGLRATYPPSYSPVDFDGNGVGQPTAPTNFSTSYAYPAGTYGNSGATNEAVQPAMLFNPYQWNPLTTSGRAGVTPYIAPANVGTQFPLADSRYLNARYSEKVKYARDATNLGNLVVTAATPIRYSESSPGHAMNRARALLTPISNRFSRPGQAPMAIGNLVNSANNAGAPALVLIAGSSAPVLADPVAAGTAVVGPKFDLATNQPYTIAAGAANSAVGGDITGSTTTNAANLRAFLQGVDLNRPLADYRDPLSRPTKPGGPPSPYDPEADWPFVPGPNPAVVNTPPVTPTTVTPNSVRQATADRQALATDIFARLCVALNARVYYTGAGLTGLNLPQPGMAGGYTLTDTPPNPPVGFVAKTWTVTQPEYDALRWVAQLSANLVDAIDPDDVSTTFVWNPVAGVPLDLTAAANFTPGPGGLSDRVVFGVEKPKLVINEAYAEVANKQADYAKNELAAGDKFTIRFFVELLNPNNAEKTNTTSTGVDVDQGARNGGRASLQFPSHSCYRVLVFDKGITAANEAASTANPNYVIGEPTAATAPKLKVDFLGIKTVVTDPTELAQLPSFVEPNNGAFRSEPSASAGPPAVVRGRKGFCVVGPELDPAKTESPATAYAPKTSTATDPANFMLMKTTPAAPGLDQLEYECGIAPPADPADIKVQVVDELNKQESHTVLLQRLANPYQPENATAYNPANGPYNPYITVDVMGGIKVNDAIRIGLKKGADGKRPTPAKPDENFALGRAQPYAGYQSLGTVGTPTFQLATDVGTPPLGTTLAVLQNPQPAPAATEPRNTFFRHNSRNDLPTLTLPFPKPAPLDETLIHAFKEPFHPDRRLVNPLEALHLTASPSHLLAYNFARPNGSSPYSPATPPTFHQEELSRVAFPTAAAGTQPSLLYRALDVLNVKPWTYGVPHAGRTPGAINVNAIWDQLNKTAGTAASGESTVFQALLDAQAANLFTPAEVNALWQRLRASRNPNWDVAIDAPMAAAVPAALGATVDEWDPTATPPGPGKDRPYKGYGVGQYDTSAGGMLSAQGLESTLLRSGATPGTPLFLDTTQTDPYRQLEALRKATNNLTTVSDNFLVVFTVGYFDVDEASLPRVVLRREAYELVPGDLRSQFTAVLDRTGLTVDANGGGGTGRFAQAAATNFARLSPDYASGGKNYAQYSLSLPADSTSTTTRLKVRDMPTANGSLFTLEAGSSVRVGDGPNASTMSVISLSVFDATTGLVTATLNSGIEVDATGNPVIPAAPALPQRLPNHAAGELVSLPDNEVQGGVSAADRIFVPGNPGKVANFSPGDARFRGVVRYFGQLKP